MKVSCLKINKILFRNSLLKFSPTNEQKEVKNDAQTIFMFNESTVSWVLRKYTMLFLSIFY